MCESNESVHFMAFAFDYAILYLSILRENLYEEILIHSGLKVKDSHLSLHHNLLFLLKPVADQKRFKMDFLAHDPMF